MPKILKTILTILIPLAISYTIVKIIKPSNVNFIDREDVKHEEIVNSLFKDITLESAAVFLYTSDYKTRYLFATNTDIVNPISNVENDSFFLTLLEYNQEGVCTVIRTSNLPTDSSLYLALESKDLVDPNIFYMACPIFTKRGSLAGYLSKVFTKEDNGVVINLQKLKYYTSIVESNLESIL